jgi:hypothetical protein
MRVFVAAVQSSKPGPRKLIEVESISVIIASKGLALLAANALQQVLACQPKRLWAAFAQGIVKR